MKTRRKLALGGLLACCLCVNAFAIEGLQIGVISTNAVLSWPSTNTETYLIQYRPTLTPDSSWLTLTDYFAASAVSNVTCFVHSNIVMYPPGSTNSSKAKSGPPAPGAAVVEAQPMVSNGQGAGVPLALYPPGFDLAGLTIYDPTTKESVVASSGDTVNPTTTSMQAAQPLTSGTNGANATQYDGFYRVVRDGVHLWGITNGMVLDNVLVTSLELGLTNADQVVGISFYDTNNSPLIGASAVQLGGNNWLLEWNTTVEQNGNYCFYAEADFANDDPVVSAPVTVTVNNTISFPNYFSQVYGDQLWVYAQTITNAAYQLDIYDDNTNYLGSFAGAADANGNISFLWNLVDSNDNLSSSTNFLGVFTVTTAGSSDVRSKVAVKSGNVSKFITPPPVMKSWASGVKPLYVNPNVHPNTPGSAVSANQLWVQEGTWVPNNNWVLAYSPLTDPLSDPNTSLKESYMMLGGADGEDVGVIGALDAYNLNGNLSPGNVAQGTAFELADPPTRTALLGYLGDHHYENFYYFGHGNSSAIGAYHGSGSTITLDQIAFDLANVPLSYNDGDPVFDQYFDPDVPTMEQPTLSPSIIHAAEHPYRFVFLDGCSTASGNLCEAFGIPAVVAGTNFFATAGVESRAFVGYTQPHSWNANTWDSYSIMMAGFMEDWLSNTINVQACISGAQNYAHEPVVKMHWSAMAYGAVDLLQQTRTRP